MSKKQHGERQSLIMISIALALMIITSWPAEITIEEPMSVIAVVCYAATSVVIIIQWIKHFLKYRNTKD